MNKFILLSFFVLSCYYISGQEKNISIGPQPNWIESVENSKSTITNIDNIGSGCYYRLLDFQSNIEKQSFFSHYTVEILNHEGIQQVSDINIDFDPSFQDITFHKINIIRNGESINKLSESDIKTVQRETNMERFLYDGTVTAFINLTDVRKGDIIDYSFTIKGLNPVYENKYHTKIYFQYGIPIDKLFSKLITSNTRKLNLKYFNDAPKADIQELNDTRIYKWELHKLEALIYDTNTPSWYDPSPNVSISEFDSWSQVANQYSKHYRISDNNRNKLEKKVKKLFKNVPKDSLLSKIRTFIQDDIRYLGFEGGLNSHIPTTPNNVLDQRYGDCKAKSFLLAETLKIFNIEAYPILVHSYNGKNIKEELPSPNAFNHCIVHVVKDNSEYFIDPTISHQGGSIENLHTPDYKIGLLLNHEKRDLISIKYKTNNKTRILEEYDIDEIGGSAYLFITTKYSGAGADNQRELFAQRDKNKIAKDYLNFYSALYPSIKEFSKIEFIDDRIHRNEVTIKEAYFIDSLWTKSPEDPKILYSEFYPLNLESYTNLSKSPQRTMPYYVSYPVDLEHKIVVNLPEDWNISPEHSTIEGESFRYTYDVDYSYRKINLTHSYKTFQSYIPSNLAASFIAKHEKIQNELSYLLTYNTNYIGDNTGISWILLLIGIISIGLFTFFGIKIYTSYNKESQNPREESLKIGGWLILIAIGITITPIRSIIAMYTEFDNFFSAATWAYISQEHSSLTELSYSLLIILEIIYNAAFLVYSILIAILFYQRRTILPQLIIIYYVVTFAFTVLDTVVAFSLNDTLYSETDKIEAYKDIARSLFVMVIWVPYFLVSKRVKSTFTENYSGVRLF
ncbi:DUF3857 domain-containing protein [Aquimarina brevivitae]|nr:DUF3857 domain-containing protein [Aquimarina brevivitae]